jgi:hypothetical protein
MSRVKAVVGAASLAIVLALGVVLSGSPLTVAAVNTPDFLSFGEVTHAVSACQSHEFLPSGTSAIRLQLFASTGPPVTVRVLEHGHLIAHGERKSAWTGGAVTVPVHPLSTARSGVSVCFAFTLDGYETIGLKGHPTGGALSAQTHYGSLGGRVRVEDMRPGRSSWLSIAPQVARRMGLGHAASGTWGVLFVLCLMASVSLLSVRAILRELG